MNVVELEKALLRAARAQTPGDQVPYAFEKRVMARLREGLPPVDFWTAWSRSLWRATVPCLALTLVLAAWSCLSNGPGISNNPGGTSNNLSQEMDNTVLAAIDQEQTPDLAE